MKNFICLIFLGLTLFVGGNQAVFAQEKRLNSSPTAFRTFFAKFKSAVEKSSKTEVAAMTRFPFQYGFDAGDEGTMTKAQFIRRFSEIFGSSPKQFLTEKNPRFAIDDDGTYIVSTEDATHLSFVKDGNSFKFTTYIVEP